MVLAFLDRRVSLGLDLLTLQVCETLAESPNKGQAGAGESYMNHREILIHEVEGKVIRSMRLFLTGASGETEISIDFADGTSFSGTVCQHTEVEAELYIGGTGEPQVIKRYGEI